MPVYLIYSRPKVGKSTLALKDAPKGKTAVINADQGLVGIDTTGLTLVDDITSRGLNKVLTNQFIAKHQRFVIDTATSLHEAFFEEAQGGNSQARYGVANSALASIIRTLRDEKKEVIILAQEKLLMPNEEWDTDDEDEEVSASVTVDLTPGAAKAVLTMSDVIGRLYIANVNEKPVRRLWLTPTASIVAGARSKTYHGTPPYLKQPSIGRLNQLLGWTR